MAQLAATAAVTAATTLLTRASVTASLSNEEKRPDHGLMKEEEVEQAWYNSEEDGASQALMRKSGLALSKRFGDDFYGHLDSVVSEIKQHAYKESDPVKKLQVEKIATSIENGGRYCNNDIQIKRTAESMETRIDLVKTQSNNPEMIEQLDKMKMEVNQIQRLNRENIQTTFENAITQYNDYTKIVNSPSLSPKQVKCAAQLLALEYQQPLPESEPLELQPSQQVNQNEIIGEEDLEEKGSELGTSIIEPPSMINSKNVYVQELEEPEPGSVIQSEVSSESQERRVKVPHIAWFVALACILLRQLKIARA